MKKLNFLFALVILLNFVRCTDEAEQIANEQKIATDASLNAKWKLTGLVNISDEEKYLNSVLEFQAPDKYTVYWPDGSTMLSGKVTKSGDNMISLDHGILDEYPVELEITTLNAVELSLKEHYTFDNKDAYLEYHWTKQ